MFGKIHTLTTMILNKKTIQNFKPNYKTWYNPNKIKLTIIGFH
jgi:secreted Zn-dependent insulinase-like peptidase